MLRKIKLCGIFILISAITMSFSACETIYSKKNPPVAADTGILSADSGFNFTINTDTSSPINVSIPDFTTVSFVSIDNEEKERLPEQPWLTDEPESVSVSSEQKTIAATEYIDLNAPIQEEDTSWAFFLVNRSHTISASYVPPLSYIQGNFTFDSRAAKYAKKMIAAASRDGVKLTVISSYRSYSKQKTNFNNYVAEMQRQGYSFNQAYAITASQIQLPGASEHNAGVAIDFNSLEENFDHTKEFRWLSENAHKYGFILRYLKNHEPDQDGIIYEPWHYRFIGFEYAKPIKDSGLTLEQYMQVHGYMTVTDPPPVTVTETETETTTETETILSEATSELTLPPYTTSYEIPQTTTYSFYIPTLPPHLTIPTTPIVTSTESSPPPIYSFTTPPPSTETSDKD